MVFADASEEMMFAVAYLRTQPNEYPADLAFVIGKCREAPMRHLSIPQLELQAAFMSVMFLNRYSRNLKWRYIVAVFGQNQLYFCSGYTVPIVANRVAEILDATDVSQWKHVSGINNPVRPTQSNIEDIKRNEWPTGPACLKRPENEWPEQLTLIFASVKVNVASSVFMIQADDKNWLFSRNDSVNLTDLNTVAYVQRALSKYKAAKLIVSFEESENAKAIIFKFLHQEQFGEEMKSLKPKQEIPEGSKIL